MTPVSPGYLRVERWPISHPIHSTPTLDKTEKISRPYTEYFLSLSYDSFQKFVKESFLRMNVILMSILWCPIKTEMSEKEGKGKKREGEQVY